MELSLSSIKLKDNKYNKPTTGSYSYWLNGAQEEKLYRKKKIEESLLLKYVGSSLGKQFRPFWGIMFPSFSKI
jgi:hypothetical protein